MSYEMALYKLNTELIAFKRTIMGYYGKKLAPGQYFKGVKVCKLRVIKSFIKYTYEVTNPDREYIVYAILRSGIMYEAMQLVTNMCRKYQINMTNDYVTMDIYI